MTAKTNYAVPPGSYLKEWLDDEGITQEVAAQRLGVSRKTINQIVRGGNVSPDHAARLGRISPISADVWVRIQAQYDADRERLRQESSLGAQVDRISTHVRKFLKEHGYVKSDARNPGKLSDEFLRFHGVATWEAFDECSLDPVKSDFALAFRTETRKASLEPTSLVTWLRACELAPEMDGLDELTYSEQMLRESLSALRARTANPDSQMISDLARMLRQSGVVLTAHEAPTAFPLHGVTRWINGIPVIHQTLRQRRDGFIVFTLFHELGHVLNDAPGETHLDDVEANGKRSSSEKAADEFAWEVLLPGDARARIRGLESDREIRAAAHELEVSPGLLVFQLHRTRALDRRYGNNLTVRL
jgi:HTH-type transcriptional regulator / antitoxin HigA